MQIKTSINGTPVTVNDVCVAANTFLGSPGDRGAKPTYVVLTEQRLYVGPSLLECTRMLNERKDVTSISYAGIAAEQAVKDIGDLLYSILGQSIFR